MTFAKTERSWRAREADESFLSFSVLFTQMRGVSHSFSLTYDAFLAQKDAERNEDSSLFDVWYVSLDGVLHHSPNIRHIVKVRFTKSLVFFTKKKYLLTALFCNRNWILGFLAIYSKAVLSFSKLLVSSVLRARCSLISMDLKPFVFSQLPR